MTRPARIVAVDHIGPHRLRLTFTDGLVRELDFAGALGGGVFAPLEDEDYFGQASIDPAAGTISWPNGVDLDPDVLHGDEEPADGVGPSVIREYRVSVKA